MGNKIIKKQMNFCLSDDLILNASIFKKLLKHKYNNRSINKDYSYDIHFTVVTHSRDNHTNSKLLEENSAALFQYMGSTYKCLDKICKTLPKVQQCIFK